MKDSVTIFCSTDISIDNSKRCSFSDINIPIKLNSEILPGKTQIIQDTIEANLEVKDAVYM